MTDEKARPIEELDENMAAPDSDGDDLLWYDAQRLCVEGMGWPDEAGAYQRFPERAEARVDELVWHLSRHSAGVRVRFITDTPCIGIRWHLRFEQLHMHHMPMSGCSGVDLYGRDGGQWRWVASGSPTESRDVKAVMTPIRPGRREYLLYLPLYNGVDRVEVGLPRGVSVSPAPRRPQRPICFYGTSITHGACASRAGLSYAAILHRRLDWPVYNVGFSGNGKMHPEVGKLLAELDPAMYVLDCVPNMEAELLAERAVPFLKTLRAAHPDTPIVLVEGLTRPNSYMMPDTQRYGRRNEVLRTAYQQLQDDGAGNLHWMPGENLLGDDDEATVDGVHPNDIGFFRMAEALEPTLRELL